MWTVALFLAAAYVPAAIALLFRPGEWYLVLAKPEWTPTPGVFGAVTLLLALAVAGSGYLAWRSAPVDPARPLRLYALLLALSALWPALFFGLQRPGVALIALLALGVGGSLTAIAYFRLRPVAGLLLVPYLLWVVFACVLNVWIAYLN